MEDSRNREEEEQHRPKSVAAVVVHSKPLEAEGSSLAEDDEVAHVRVMAAAVDVDDSPSILPKEGKVPIPSTLSEQDDAGVVVDADAPMPKKKKQQRQMM